MYKENRVVKASEIGFHNHIRIKDLIDVIQDLEGSHIESIEPLSALSKENNVGILLNYRYVHIKKWPVYNDALTLVTFPYDTKPFLGYRNSLVYGKNNEIIVESYCLGSFISMDTLTPYRLPLDVIEAITSSTKHPMHYEGRKINLDRNQKFVKESKQVVEASHLDYYNHLNNAFYVEFAYNQLPFDFEFDTLVCEYKYAFNYLDVMTLKTYVVDNGYIIYFYDDENNLNVIVEFRKGK
ncbi:acyl-ACP thioesterase domain-containing protein [Acholeplasma hippikon]|uniref:Acyl-ACP thioesterase n=1 Tax=Acholeplasma hippikon TaxID=264636 RepID=A0A449BJ49_9MOLU|nr:acyl-ACP thioesterase domain-containing protein [Acholeplasma hippikon]VEU82486.1 Acyl-ACP thioesterase [Acholeplasma hippikon]